MHYKISQEAKLDLARIYWHGVEVFGEVQAERYYDTLINRFDEISQNPHQYPSVGHIREGYRRSVCGADSIYYRIKGNVTEIMRVLGRQDERGEL